MSRRLISLILVEAFLFTTLGSGSVWAKPSPHSPALLRARSAAQDGAFKKTLSRSLHVSSVTSPDSSLPLFGSEAEIREKIDRQIFTPIPGGYQIQTIYLSKDYAIYVPWTRRSVFLSASTLDRIERIPLLRDLYRLINRMESPWARSVKRSVKLTFASVNGNFFDLRNEREEVLGSYALAAGAGDGIDPFLILDRIRLRTGPKGEKSITLSPIIVRERSDDFLEEELQRLVAEERLEEAKGRIEEVFRLDEALWERGLINLDLNFLRNTRVRNGRVVLRDLGNITDDGAQIPLLLDRLHTGTLEEIGITNPVRKTVERLSGFAPPELAEYYRQRAYEVYSVENFLRHWSLSLDSTPASDGGNKTSEKDREWSEKDRQILRWIIPRAALFGSLVVIPSAYVAASNLLDGYTYLRSHFTWQTDVAAGALVVGVSDLLGQWMAYRSKGVPILRKQLTLATALGGFFGWTYGVFYHWIEPFSFWNRVGLAALVGSTKGALYALMVGKIKIDSLPKFRDYYRTRNQIEKFTTVMVFEIPLRLLRHVAIQGWVDPFYRQIVSFASNAVLAPIGGWIFNRLQVPLPGLVRFMENGLARLGVDVREKGARDGGEKSNFIPYAEIEEALGSLDAPIQRSSEPVKGLIRFDAEGTLWVDPFVMDHPVPRIFFEKVLLPALQFEKLLLSRFGFGEERGDGVEDQEWTLEILGLQPFAQGIISLSEEERELIREWVNARFGENPREDLLMLRRLLSLGEWVEQPEVQERFLRNWLEQARSPEEPDRHRDGGAKEIFFHDTIRPTILWKPVAVESGV